MRILSFILWAPFFGAILVVLLPTAQHRIIRSLALFHAGLALVLSWSLLAQFDRSTAAIQFVEQVVWSSSIGVSYALGLDGISLPMVLLSTLLVAVALLASNSVTVRAKGYYAWLLILEFAMLGVFMARDWSLFFMFWELTLIPLFFLIDLWGGEKRHVASLNFVLYTMGGAIFILIGIIMVYRLTPTQSFAMAAISQAAASLPRNEQVWLLLAFLVGFGVKIPIFPLHGWLPLAHVEAPSPVSILLSGALLKMGAYGLLRVVSMLPQGTLALQPLLVGIALVSILYGGLLAWRQSDLKAMIAYSSVSHMGVVLLGISALNEIGLLGATLQMVAHGLIAGALFLLIGLLYERTHTRQVADYGALVRLAPGFSLLLTLALLAGMGLPGLGGFVAELHVLIGGFERWGWLMLLASLGVLISAAYAVRTMGQLFTGPVRPAMGELHDLQPHEWVAAMPLAAGLVILGLYPAPVIALLSATVKELATIFTYSL
ncbi:complex I subunit 4 family protein [Candidatus Contendibacter odensensis]|uniref:NADH-quinone oxidoreductase subunit M n=1 Tax=Candidatus Contendobacter odensis Run_B_J11 TaxID=1400861 RepID=A0A7U7GFI5_9GAMM|nr:NADH-quinone oxidoreductase subunit M [Candidatus Contendobacter odensis]CDH47457.1 Proton-translocating NADH-quinone oxidoreductase, chain M [Candidatus Contendobacter odensis Run_B_J11]